MRRIKRALDDPQPQESTTKQQTPALMKSNNPTASKQPAEINININLASNTDKSGHAAEKSQ